MDRLLHAQYRRGQAQVASFERAFGRLDGALVLKFWMHISRDVQKERLELLENDPLRSWRLSPDDWKHWEMYDKFIEAAERIISYTNTGHAPWEIVEGADFNYRSIRVGEIFQQTLERHLMSQQFRQKYLDEMREGRITLVLVAPRCDTCGYFPWYKFPGALDEKTVRRLFKLLNDGLEVFKRR